jgi:hypothetical protein
VLRHHTTSEMRRVFVRFETRQVIICRIEDDFNCYDLIDKVYDKLMLGVPIDTLALYSGDTQLEIDAEVPFSSKTAPLVLKRIQEGILIVANYS